MAVVDSRIVGPQEAFDGELLDAVVEVVPGLSLTACRTVALHNDLSHHNVGFDTRSSLATGVFDFAGAVVGDPHRDLRYDPSIEFEGDAMLRAYEEARGLEMSLGRQRAWHAASALENLRWSLDNEDEVLQGARWGWVDAVAAWDLRVLTS